MKFCTLLICCVFLAQNVIGESDNSNTTTTEGPEIPDQDENDYGYNPEPRNHQNLSTIKFSSKLYEAVKESQPPNFALSPLSLANALAMVGLGARGETANEILKYFGSKNNTRLIDAQSNLITSLKEISSWNSSVKFVTADKMYAKFGLTIKTEYQNDVTRLGGEIETVDFGNSEDAAGKINSWVKEKTEGKIEKLVEASALNSQTSLLVLNSIYFKGSWENKFDNSSTKKKPFFVNGSCSVSVDMMYQKNEFQFADLQEAKAQVLVLPYKGDRLSMMIYLPNGNEESSLSNLENWLESQSALELQNFKIGLVSVSLPKFKIRSSLKLNEPLKKLGLGKMFDTATADFSGIFNNSRNLFVSQVSQETFIEVNEEGTEAAAATGFQVVATSFSETPEFTADRPFLFQIVDSKTKTVLFTGRVKNPLDSGSGESPVSAGHTNEPTCADLKEVESTTTNTSTSQNIDTAGNETKFSCEGNQKANVEKLLLLFCNSTEDFNNKNNVSTRVARIAEDVMRCAAEKAEVINQNLTQTVQNLKTEMEKLKQDQKKRNETDLNCNTGNKMVTSTTTEKTRALEDPQGNLPSFPPAAAYGYFWGSGKEKVPEWNYDSTTNGSCAPFTRKINTVFVNGSSCVALYKDQNCTLEKFQMDTTNLSTPHTIRFPFDVSNSTNSIGVCS